MALGAEGGSFTLIFRPRSISRCRPLSSPFDGPSLWLPLLVPLPSAAGPQSLCFSVPLHNCIHFRICFYFHLISEHTYCWVVAGKGPAKVPCSGMYPQRPHSSPSDGAREEPPSLTLPRLLGRLSEAVPLVRGSEL